ncbi:MAG: hypothetical protein U0136_08810 [Bdellovibrionota bacterium]
MNESGLPKELHELVLRFVDSLEELEILLLLRGADNQAWSVRAVNERIRSTEVSVEQRLEKLSASGFVSKSGNAYRFAPQSKDLERAAELLAEGYRERRLKIIEAIFSKPLHGIRSFSDAFIIRTKKE